MRSQSLQSNRFASTPVPSPRPPALLETVFPVGRRSSSCSIASSAVDRKVSSEQTHTHCSSRKKQTNSRSRRERGQRGSRSRREEVKDGMTSDLVRLFTPNREGNDNIFVGVPKHPIRKQIAHSTSHGHVASTVAFGPLSAQPLPGHSIHSTSHRRSRIN